MSTLQNFSPFIADFFHLGRVQSAATGYDIWPALSVTMLSRGAQHYVLALSAASVLESHARSGREMHNAIHFPGKQYVFLRKRFNFQQPRSHLFHQ
jgi:hypothetical protein